MRRRDERPHLGILVIGGADLHRGDLRLDTAENVVGDRVADEHRDRDRHAALAGGAVGGADQRVRRELRIGVRHHHRVVLRAAERLNALAVRGSRRIDVARDRCRADEAHRRDPGMVQDRVDRLLVAMHHLEDAVRNPGLLEQLGQD